MTAEDVLAVVVSYNGLHKTKETVDALRGQVGHVAHMVGTAATKAAHAPHLPHRPVASFLARIWTRSPTLGRLTACWASCWP